jgi:hypothetical protein
MYRCLWFLFTLLLVFPSCKETPTSPRSFQQFEEDDIRETVLRSYFFDNGSGLSTIVSTFYIEFITVDSLDPHDIPRIVARADPPDRFMNRFKGNNPPVKKASQCIYGPPPIDLETGTIGLLFSIAGVKWISSMEADVYGEFRAGANNRGGDTFHLRKVDNKWVVFSRSWIWIS